MQQYRSSRLGARLRANKYRVKKMVDTNDEWITTRTELKKEEYLKEMD